MDKGVGRRRIVWSLFWIALLGSSSASPGGGSLQRDAELAPSGRLVAEYRCLPDHVSQVDPY